MKCWGRNHNGQLGDGTKTDRATPTDVNGLASGVKAITAGDYHACALTTSGGVKCWGDNESGQLGDGSNTARPTPANVNGLTSGVTGISAGFAYSCALTSSGGLKCWGRNAEGQLGDGTNTDRSTPVNVSGLTAGVTAIAAGSWHTCAATDDGGVKCWGRNTEGQLGDGTNKDRTKPANVQGLISAAAALTIGWSHTCALTTYDGVKCWGSNENGAVGDGSSTERSSAVSVDGLWSGVTAIAAGDWHSCWLTLAGGLKCWGGNNYGNIGDGSTSLRRSPVNVVGGNIFARP